jgi:hypothetical protein
MGSLQQHIHMQSRLVLLEQGLGQSRVLHGPQVDLVHECGCQYCTRSDNYLAADAVDPDTSNSKEPEERIGHDDDDQWLVSSFQ